MHLGPGALAWAGVLGAGGAAGGIPSALIWWALSAASDPAVRETAITAATAARQAAAQAADAAAAVVSAHSQGERYCMPPIQAGLMALAVVLLLLAVGLVACCSVGTLPLGVLGGHIWGRLTARSPFPAAVARAVASAEAPAPPPPPVLGAVAAAGPAPGPEPVDLEDENYTLALAESIIARDCQPAALAATAIEFRSSLEAVARWLQAYRDAVAGPVPDDRHATPMPHRRRGRGWRVPR